MKKSSFLFKKYIVHPTFTTQFIGKNIAKNFEVSWFPDTTMVDFSGCLPSSTALPQREKTKHSLRRKKKPTPSPEGSLTVD